MEREIRNSTTGYSSDAVCSGYHRKCMKVYVVKGRSLNRKGTAQAVFVLENTWLFWITPFIKKNNSSLCLYQLLGFSWLSCKVRRDPAFKKRMVKSSTEKGEEIPSTYYRDISSLSLGNSFFRFENGYSDWKSNYRMLF